VKHSITRIVLRFIGLMLLSVGEISCIDLQYIADYANHAAKSLVKSDKNVYTFTRHCLEQCRMETAVRFDIQRKQQCPCESFAQADKTVDKIETVLNAYFMEMASLCGGKVSDLKFDGLSTSLEKNSGLAPVTNSDVEAFTKISGILSQAVLNRGRMETLKSTIKESDSSIQILLSKLSFIEREDLVGLSQVKRDWIYNYYGGLVKNSGLDEWEKLQATVSYYQQLDSALRMEAQLNSKSSALMKIASGHHLLKANLNTLTEREVKDQLKKMISDASILSAAEKEINRE
jgi:hypothetical protein